MTVILGINLSDRIYLAADSRLSQKVENGDGSHDFSPKHDNMQKVESLARSGGVIIASAGNADFAQYIIKRLPSADFYGDGIKAFRDNIEEWIKEPALEYFANKGYSSVTFLFAGADTSQKKTIIGKDILPLIKAYGGKEDGNSGVLKQIIADGITSKGEGVPNPTPELPIDNTMLFSVTVNQAGVFIKDSKWGEFIIHGPQGVVQEDVALQNIGSLEFQQGAGDFDHDVGLVAMMIQDLAERKQLDTVGGCVITMAAHGDGNTYIMDGDIHAINPATGEHLIVNRFKIVGNTFYRVDERGTMYKLTPVSKYRSSGHLAEHLFI